MKKAVFLDRDGVLVRDSNYPHKIEDLQIFPEVAEALKMLKKAGYITIVISNQSGVARGLFTEEDIKKFNLEMKKKLEKEGAIIDAIYFCPHHPTEARIEKYKKDCECRKPKPGMLLKAAKDFGISLKSSWMIGDKEEDVSAGKSAGCRTIKIGKSRGGADFVARNLLGAQKKIFSIETNNKLVEETELSKIIRKAKLKNKKIVFTNGCFDILHAGHVDYLKKAKRLGDLLIVGLNSDESVKRIKGANRPINSEFMRAKVLSSLEVVDKIIIFKEDTPELLVKKIKPDIYVKGGDWKLEQLPEKKIVESYGGKVELIDIIEETSTTEIVKKIAHFSG
jgi:rfaE bifunctional protein nucleotidyltransferase chain/domain